MAEWLPRGSGFGSNPAGGTSLRVMSFRGDTKAVGPFYLVSMPGEVKDHIEGVNVQPVLDSTTLRE